MKPFKAKGKLLHLVAYDTIGAFKNGESIWADVWIEFTSKPGRSKKKYGPCICSLADMHHSLEVAERSGDLDEAVAIRS
jgi:hypothetical protein